MVPKVTRTDHGIDLRGHDNYECLYLDGECIRLGARSNRRLGLVDWLCVKDRRVLDIGCNAGLFAREAKRRGAAEVVGIDKGDVIRVARNLAEAEGLDVDFRQMAFESDEFRELALEGWDIVFACAVHRHYQGDANEFLQLIDRSCNLVLFFETNFKTGAASYLELLDTWMTFDNVRHLGFSGDPTIVDMYPGREVEDFYMYRAARRAVPRDERDLPVADFTIEEIDASNKVSSVYTIDGEDVTNERVARLAENIARNGLRFPVSLQWKADRWQLWEGAHRFMAVCELGWDTVSCRYRGKGLNGDGEDAILNP